MFNSVSGTITGKDSGSIFIENSGIEWDLLVSTLSLDAFGPIGSEAKIYTWLYHREDSMRLFGFISPRERSIFIDLMKVDGVGPKQALKILSSISVSDLETALESEDVSRLEAAPGIGKKTAQKMILALKGKLTPLDDARKRLNDKKSDHEDIVTALTNMGFDRKAALNAVDDAVANLKAERANPTGSAPIAETALEQEIFRRAIIALSS